MDAFIFSADSHAAEPPNMWGDWIDPEYRDRAPRSERQFDERLQLSTDVFLAEDVEPTRVSGFFAARMFDLPLADTPEEAVQRQALVAEVWKAGWDGAPASVYNTAARLAEQDLDGVNGELIYPGMAMLLFGMRDIGLQRACFDAYNRWIVEYCSHDLSRLVPIGIVCAHDIPTAVADLEHAVTRGLKGAFLWGSPPDERPYSHPSFDPLWAAAAANDFPLTLHDLMFRGAISFNGANYHALPMEIELTLADMVLSGVFERHPNLKMVSAENDVSWFPHFMYRMDHAVDKLRGGPVGAQMSMRPSDYVKRNIWGTFQFENREIPFVNEFLGAQQLMWGSDYPHPDGTFPNSRTFLADAFPGLDEDDKSLIIGGSAMRLYNVKQPVGAAG
jgi:predicted TIM-barrel fold metal-dependent hydrolase